MLTSSLLPAPDEPNNAAPLALKFAAEQAQTPQELAQIILSHNIFDSETGSMPWEAPRESPPAPVGGTDDDGFDLEGAPGPCQAALRLVGSFVMPRRPALSLASIESEGKSTLYRTGMQVEGHELVGIREHRAFLRPSGRPLCQLAMFRPPQGVATPSPEETVYPMAPAASTLGGLSEDELARGITQVSDARYSVARSLLREALANPAELLKRARTIPYEEHGRVIGMKIYGVRPTSVLGRLGIQNGDLLRTINGLDLASPDSALEAYGQLREYDRFTLAIVRRGEARNIDYTIDG